MEKGGSFLVRLRLPLLFGRAFRNVYSYEGHIRNESRGHLVAVAAGFYAGFPALVGWRGGRGVIKEHINLPPASATHSREEAVRTFEGPQSKGSCSERFLCARQLVPQSEVPFVFIEDCARGIVFPLCVCVCFEGGLKRSLFNPRAGKLLVSHPFTVGNATQRL